MIENPQPSGVLAWLHSLRLQYEEATDTDNEGLRERKKRQTRKQISDTATMMFMLDGFDSVRVTEIAAACGVSEKTVYNYFPTKESLVLDQEDEMVDAIERELGPGTTHASPVDAMVAIINDKLKEFVVTAERHGLDDMAMIRSFINLVEDTPSLRAAQFDMTERLSLVAARAMALRAGVDPQSPEAQMAGDALLGLWRVSYRAFIRYARPDVTPRQFERLVRDETTRAARLLDSGLWSFAMVVQGRDTREQLRLAAESSLEAHQQVLKAIRQSKHAWHAAKKNVSPEDADLRRRLTTRETLNETRRSVIEAKRSMEQAKLDILKIRDEVRQQAKGIKTTARSKKR